MAVSRKIPPAGDNPRRMADAINAAIDGRTDNYGSFELTTGTSTTVIRREVSSDSCIVLSPISASASGLAWWISAQGSGSFTISHAAGGAGRMFRYAFVG